MIASGVKSSEGYTASVVSVTNIHWWLSSEHVTEVRSHLEILRLYDQEQIQKLASGQGKLQRLRAVRRRIIHYRLEDSVKLCEDDRPEVCQMLSADTTHDDAETEIDL